jgi:hypothetical protein
VGAFGYGAYKDIGAFQRETLLSVPELEAGLYV